MKKVFVYLTVFVLIFFIQGCNGTSTGTNESTAKESTTKKKNAFSISASDVPAAVISTFKAKYPNASNVNWEKATEKGKPSFKAKWQIDGKKMKAEFSEDGSFIKEKQED